MKNRTLIAAIACSVVFSCERAPREHDHLQKPKLPAIVRGGAPTPVGSVVRLTRTSLEIDGRHVADRGQPDVWASLNSVMQIESLLEGLKSMTPTPAVLTLEVDRETPYTVVFSLLWTGARAGVEDVRLAVTQQSHAATIRFDVRPYTRALPNQLPVRPVIRIERDVLALYSMSGLEGMSHDPAVTVPRDRAGYTRITRALEDIAVRHYGASPAPPDDIVVVASDGNLPIREVVDVVGAVLATETGQPLFQTISLAYLW